MPRSIPSASIPPPPPGTIWLAEVSPALTFSMIGATMGSALVVMLLALFFFSTPALRRKPIFVLNALALLLGIAGAIINVYEEIHSLLYPTKPLNPQVIVAMGAFEGFTPTLVDSILLLRLYAVYPYRRTPLLKFLIILGVPVLLKFVRVVNASIFIHNYSRTVQASNGVEGASVISTTTLPNIKIEWSLQVFDDVWSSVIFLSRVYIESSFSKNRSLSQRVQSLFWISVSNFVFPLILGVLQLAIYLSKPDDYVTILSIEVFNFHFTIIGVVFATVWMAEGHWAHSRGISSGSTAAPNLTPVAFATPSVARGVRSETQATEDSDTQFDIGGGRSRSTTTYYMPGSVMEEVKAYREDKKHLGCLDDEALADTQQVINIHGGPLFK